MHKLIPILIAGIMFITSCQLAANNFDPDTHPWPTNLLDYVIIFMWASSLILFLLAQYHSLCHDREDNRHDHS